MSHNYCHLVTLTEGNPRVVHKQVNHYQLLIVSKALTLCYKKRGLSMRRNFGRLPSGPLRIHFPVGQEPHLHWPSSEPRHPNVDLLTRQKVDHVVLPQGLSLRLELRAIVYRFKPAAFDSPVRCYRNHVFEHNAMVSVRQIVRGSTGRLHRCFHLGVCGPMQVAIGLQQDKPCSNLRCPIRLLLSGQLRC